MTGLEPAQAEARYPLKKQGGFIHLLDFNILTYITTINCARFA